MTVQADAHHPLKWEWKWSSQLALLREGMRQKYVRTDFERDPVASSFENENIACLQVPVDNPASV
jgi:hypothetical protein